MNELAKHLEILLLENNCVIIPGFGGFITHHSNAHRIEDEELFLPPTRTIGFNPHLKINDGLLVQSYMQAYDTDFADASKRVDEAVETLTSSLQKNGTIEFHGIGKMSLTIDNICEFHPNEDGLLTPELYGLSSFAMRILSSDSRNEEKRINPAANPQNVYEIKINRSFLKYAATVAAAIITFFFLSVPVENTYVEEENYAMLDAGGIFESIRNHSLATSILPVQQKNNSQQKTIPAKNNRKNLKPVSIRTEKVAPREIKAVKVENETKKTEITPASQVRENPEVKTSPVVIQQSAKYNIIVASVGTRKDAEKMVTNLKSKGYSAASVIEGNGKTRISLMSFGNQQDAYSKIKRLKEEGAFKDAWVLKIN